MSTSRRLRRLRALVVFGAILASAVAVHPVAARAATVHRVKAGETLGGIAKHWACTPKQIMQANRLKSDMIRIGQDLKVPSSCARAAKRRDEGKPKTIDHVVARGDTLSGIALRYGVTVTAIRKANRKALRRQTLRVGTKLRVTPSKSVPTRHRFKYKIRPGDTLSRIAKRHGMVLSDIIRLNPKKNPNRLQIGQVIILERVGPEKSSHAVGRPQNGKLIDGEQLPKGLGYYRRRPRRSWGTNETIAALLSAFETVRQKHPRAHDMAVGDVSAKKGGKLPPHISHQTGRDVDLGFYFKGLKRKGPRAFISALKHPLDYAATWTLLVTMTGKSRKSSQVEYMFIDYRVQKKLYNWAKKRGVKAETLKWMFQYPRGKRAMRGIIRHEPGHANHIHVRFRCPRGDDQCA